MRSQIFNQIQSTLFLMASLVAFDASAMNPISPSFALSAGYTQPSAKQGAGEARQPLDPAVADARYARLRQMGLGYRQYNLWWSELEDKVASSTSPIACPAGSVLIPANEAERKQLGFNRFHCINSAALAKWDFLFSHDQQYGMQSGIVVWSTPKFYRYEKCEGFGFGGNHLMDPCVPRDDAMGDYEDYFNLLGSRYNGGARGKISHYIIWNENASAEWFDYTPIISRQDVSKAAVKKRIDKYTDMLKRAHDTLLRHVSGVMLYVSTDQLWEPKVHPGHIGTRILLEGIWESLGTSISWSVAVHPYGDPNSVPASNIYTFNNLEMVSNFQAQQLRKRGVSNTSEYPQTYLIASEQGQPLGSGGRAEQARFICLAHDKVMKTNSVVAVAHNYFQSVEPQELQSGGQSGQGAFFGLIPYTIPDSLEGYESTPTGAAYLATSPDYWARTNSHYCCQNHQVGCKDKPQPPHPIGVGDKSVTGVFDGIYFEGDKAYAQGWACAKGYVASIAVRLVTVDGQLLKEAVANVSSEEAVRNACGVNMGDYRFRVELTTQMRKAYFGKSIAVTGVSPVTQKTATLLNGPYYMPATDDSTSVPPSSAVETHPVYRFRRMDAGGGYAFTRIQNEFFGISNLLYEGVGFYLFEPTEPKTQTLYRCKISANREMISADKNCEGTKSAGYAGELGNAALSQSSQATQVLSRCFHNQVGHLMTKNKAECLNAGFKVEGSLGFVP